MKKQIFTLMVSVFTFAVTPLFAMDDGGVEEAQRKYHGRGKLCILSDDQLLQVGKEVNIPSLCSFSLTSTSMLSLCENVDLWKFKIIQLLPDLSKEEKDDIYKKTQIEEVKSLAKSSFQKFGYLFNKDNKHEATSMDMFKYFIRKPVPFSLGKKFEFTIGDNAFIMEEFLQDDFQEHYSRDNFFLTMILNNNSLEAKPLSHLDDEGKLQPWNDDDFNTLFKHSALNRVNKESRICFAAQPDQKYHQCNFVFLLCNKGSNEICDKWNEQRPGQLELKDYDLFREEMATTTDRTLMSEEGNSGVAFEASFKIYKKSKDLQ